MNWWKIDNFTIVPFMQQWIWMYRQPSRKSLGFFYMYFFGKIEIDDNVFIFYIVISNLNILFFIFVILDKNNLYL